MIKPVKILAQAGADPVVQLPVYDIHVTPPCVATPFKLIQPNTVITPCFVEYIGR